MHLDVIPVAAEPIPTCADCSVNLGDTFRLTSQQNIAAVPPKGIRCYNPAEKHSALHKQQQ